MNQYAIIKDIDYYISKKESIIERFTQEQKNTAPIQIEIEFLQKLKTTIKDLIEENNSLKLQLFRVQKTDKKNEENAKIVKGLQCALNFYSRSTNYNDSEKRFLLNQLLNNPTFFISLWQEQILFWKQGESEIKWIIENLPYNDLRARDILKTTCETYGYIYELKLAKWKQRADKNKQNQR